LKLRITFSVLFNVNLEFFSKLLRRIKVDDLALVSD